MKKSILLTGFVVSWVAGQTYQATPCAGKEPADVVCAKTINQIKTQDFKASDSAEAFKAVLEQMGTKSVTLEPKKK